MNILFLVRTLNSGGAERQLVNLAKGLKCKGHKVSVAVFYSGGVLQEDLGSADIPIFYLEKKHRWDIFSFFLSLFRIMKNTRPQIIHGYGSIPNCLTVIVKLFNYKIKAVWGIRASFLDLSKYDTFVRMTYKLECFLSKFSDLIIVNSKAGCKYAIANGFKKHKMIVVYNGVDTELFRPDDKARVRLRNQWNIGDNIHLVGFVGRLDPMKDHSAFIKAMGHVCTEKNNVVAVCIGDGQKEYLEQLKKKTINIGIEDNFLWKAARQDISGCMNAFDVFVSSSYGEGFPNVIGEAMATGTPCVVTDVGDSAHIIGSCGSVVPPRDSEVLASEIISMLDRVSSEQSDISHCSRERIVENFSFERLVDRSEICLNAVI